MIAHGRVENARNKEPVRSASVPGLVDGLVTTALDQDGNISVHLIVGTPGADQEKCAHIELVLKREHAGLLGESLLGARRPRAVPVDRETQPVPCCIGICINPALPDP